jgi:hypothetical protein
MKIVSSVLSLLVLLSVPAFATVVVTSPSNGQTLSPSVTYTATATTTCSSGVASMGVYVDNSLIYVSHGAALNTTLQLAAGAHNTVVEEWDYCGGATYTPVGITVTSQYGVFVTSPQNNGYEGTFANYTATATTTCSKGVAAMGVYVNNQLVYTVNGASLSTILNLSPGHQDTVVEEWDNCGGASYTPVNVTVVGTSLWSLQNSGGWNGYGEFAPLYDICSSSCSGVAWSMVQHVSSPSLSGSATQFNLGGSTPYSDALWTNPVIGQGTTQGIPDSSHTLLPTLHNFTYDAEVYLSNYSVTQNLEFDINMYMNGVGMIWGTQCDHLSDGDWDIWNNVEAAWVSTGAPCKLNNGAWNRVTIQAQRESNNDLLYQSITVNGVTYNINRTEAPFTVPSGWWGITVNYQMDGNYAQSANTTYLDSFSLTYW